MQRKESPVRRDLYQEITDRIIQEIESGSLPWLQPWQETGIATGLPFNATSKRAYSGINTVLLWLQASDRGYSSPAWCTFKQARNAGGSVRKGERATTVVWVSPVVLKAERAKAQEEGREPGRIHVLKAFHVFNVQQCDGLDDFQSEPLPSTWEPHTEAERIIDRTGADIRHGGSQAFYSRASDGIALPDKGAFRTGDEYYSTAFHELAHWTGHKSRLDRDYGKRFGDQAYAREELVAEIGSAFVCGALDIQPECRHSDYLAAWLQVLKADKRAIVTAASAAGKAADYVRGVERATA